MKRAAQAIYLVCSFLLCASTGCLLGTAFWQSRFYAEKFLQGRPLPSGTIFLSQNDRVVCYSTLLLWAILIAAPLLLRKDAETQRYCLWAFFASFALLIALCLILLFIPYIPIFTVLADDNLTIPEHIMRVILWVTCGTILVCASFPLWKKK